MIKKVHNQYISGSNKIKKVGEKSSGRFDWGITFHESSTVAVESL
jgi:hypothetical protein